MMVVDAHTLSRDQNSQADFLSRIVDFEDYSLHDEDVFIVFELIECIK